MKITGRNISKRPTNSHIVSRAMLNGKFSQKKFKEQKNFFFAYDNLWTLDKTNPTGGPNHFLHCFFVPNWKWPLQKWTRFNEIIVQQWPIIRVQDIVTFGVSVILTLFSSCQPVDSSSDQAGGRGQGPLLSLCQACCGQHPHDPLLSNMGACHHPVRRTPECTG